MQILGGYNRPISIERFSFDCRKVIGFAFTTLRDWFKKLAPLFHPIRSKTKTNRDSLLRVFSPFASATCNYFVFWLVHLIICVLCDWLEWLLGFTWFWFYDTQLKTALSTKYAVNQGCVSFLGYGRHVGQLRRRRRRAYAPTSNTASHDNHEKISSRVSFAFPW